MRVTQSMLSTNFLRNLSGSNDQLSKYQEQLSTGKKISRPSDDPVVAMMGMEYRTDLGQIEQYERNLSTAYKWMDSSDAGLDKATQVLHRVNELVIQASNGTYEEGQRGNIAEEIEQLKEHMASIANAKVSGKYIFNGTNTTTAPVNLDNAPVQVSDNTQGVKIEVNEGVEIQVNVNPQDVFTQDLFGTLDQLQTDLENGASNEAISEYISDIQGQMDNIVSARAELGARYNRVEMIENRVGEQKVTATQILSDNEDIDMEKVIMNLKTQESVHRAALSVGARIMQPTLMDFLR
jgi:flagellar hook-associated protein 3 FlgL